MKKRQLTLAQNLRQGDSGANRDARAAGPNLGQRTIVEAHDRSDRDVAFVERPHDERSTREKARRPVGRQRRGRFGGRRKSPDRYWHGEHTSITPPRANARGWRRNPPDRSPRRPFLSAVALRRPES